jgi:hypothetical protein
MTRAYNRFMRPFSAVNHVGVRRVGIMKIVGLALLFTAASIYGQTTVSSILPAAGLARGGELVHIHGTGLLTSLAPCPGAACPTAVHFGEAPATIVDDTDSEIVVLAPAHAAGPVNLVISVPPSLPVTIESAYNYQDPQSNDQVRLLVPVAINSQGALGTNWTSDLFVYNGNGEQLLVSGPAGTPFFNPLGERQRYTGQDLAPFFSDTFTLFAPAGNTGVFLYVPRRLVDNMVATLRVHETTRDGDSFGTEIPVVSETQFRPFIVLPNVPSDTRFRALLRVYSYSANDSVAMLRLRDEATGELLDTRTVVLKSGLTPVTDTPDAPAYTQVALDPLFAGFGPAHRRIRSEITPVGPAPIWAFVAITNNATEQFTTITPMSTPTPVSVPTPSRLANGHWGGQPGCIDVTDSAVILDDGCVTGSFSNPTLDADHRFEVDGTFVNKLFGGISEPAHYSGVLEGTFLTLTIRLGDGGGFRITLRLGSPGDCALGCP